jgi:hypothetical protein
VSHAAGHCAIGCGGKACIVVEDPVFEFGELGPRFDA